ncbi:multivesicular body subunit 12A [Malaclemys terrapin pileata]|uniref:multivesicular body subunit 12A n=1 Tax=Malaclemys terrapin pileata TaxID=2991368 RepID=UPI0023A858CE|nr:multivesicular body subunit 12A [Malaclemys terrapin pileata]
MAAQLEQSPLTGVAWASSPGAAPFGWTPITSTLEGATANFGKGFGQKSGYVLCITSTAASETSPGDVVADVQILSEKTPLPTGYIYIREFLEPKTSISKKKRICVKLVPLGVAELVVFDIMLSGKSKVVPCYMKIGEISSFAVWCKKGHLLKPKPLPKPRNISPAMKGLSLETTDLDNKKTEISSEKSLTRIGSKYVSLKRDDSIYDTSNLYGISAMDGVPFALHPRFESSITTRTNAFSIFTDLNIKSLSDIEKEYDYAFVVERTAAARLPPSIC